MHGHFIEWTSLTEERNVFATSHLIIAIMDQTVM
jgi:hypothetical protein